MMSPNATTTISFRSNLSLTTLHHQIVCYYSQASLGHLHSKVGLVHLMHLGHHPPQPLLKIHLTLLDLQLLIILSSKHSQVLQHLVHHLSNNNNNSKMSHNNSSSPTSLMHLDHRQLPQEDSMHLHLRHQQVRDLTGSSIGHIMNFHIFR